MSDKKRVGALICSRRKTVSLNSRFSTRLMILPSTFRKEDEHGAKKKRVQGSNPVCYLSQHGSHTYIEAYLFSMITVAYLCIKTVYFNLYWMVYVSLGLLRCYFFFSVCYKQKTMVYRCCHRTWYESDTFQLAFDLKNE